MKAMDTMIHIDQSLDSEQQRTLRLRFGRAGRGRAAIQQGSSAGRRV